MTLTARQPRTEEQLDPAAWPGELYQRQAGLAAVVNHLLDRGVVVAGDATLSLAGIDLVYARLQLVLASVETLRGEFKGQWSRVKASSEPHEPAGGELASMSAVASGSARSEPAAAAPSATGPSAQPALNLEPGTLNSEPATLNSPGAEQGLARLVLTLVELLRQVVERQALRRAEGGGLPDEDLERLGTALMRLEEQMRSLCALFGLSLDDLDLDLGPLGRIA